MGKIKIAVAGVGNCCSALLQGIEYAKNGGTQPLGLIYENFGEYIVSDIEFVAAFDIVEGKVGKDLSEAIFGPPNNMYSLEKISSDVSLELCLSSKGMRLPPCGIDINIGSFSIVSFVINIKNLLQYHLYEIQRHPENQIYPGI